MSKITDETLTDQLVELANEWEAVRRGEHPTQDNNIWWLNQKCYLAERFGVALIDDLLAARGLPPRAARPALETRYHVPHSQVYPGSRGGQAGKVHLHVIRGPFTFAADNGRTIRRGGGVALCGKKGWYERPAEGEERCPRCVDLSERYNVKWPEASQ